MKKIKNIMIIFLTVSTLVLFAFLYMDWRIERNPKMDSSIVEEKLKSILELSTLEYHYTEVTSFKEDIKIKNISIPFTKKGFLIKYEGTIKAGVTLENLKVTIEENKRLKINLKKAQILENNIHEEDMYIYDESSSLFNPLKYEDLYKILPQEKEKKEKELIEKGFLEEAEKNVKKFMETMFEEMQFEEVEVTFK